MSRLISAADIRAIWDNLPEIDADNVGIRVIDSADRPLPQIGDILPPSRRWEDNNIVEGDYLNGTSAITVHSQSSYGRGQLDHIGGYYGDTILIIVGDDAEGGEDIGEIIIRQARVVDIIFCR
jgi:hypothetical protein